VSSCSFILDVLYGFCPSRVESCEEQTRYGGVKAAMAVATGVGAFVCRASHAPQANLWMVACIVNGKVERSGVSPEIGSDESISLEITCGFVRR
jgi:hypothetical protein